MEVLYDVFAFLGVIFCLFVLSCGIIGITNFLFKEEEECSQDNAIFTSSNEDG